MSKSHRGRGIRETVNHGRGTCPVCKRSGIKVLYEHEAGAKKILICKQCRAALKHNKKQDVVASL
jgi:hypothetical protein